MPDILLIQPPIEDFYLTRKRTIPYGLACLAAALEKEGFTVDLFDALATARSRPLERPDEMAYLDPFFGKPDVSPFALFHQFRHFGYSYQHIRHVIKASGVFMVGISSLFTAYSDAALKVAAAVKAVRPEAVVVMGGHHPTALPEAVMQSPDVDYVIRGEAETALPGLARAVKSGRSAAGIPGIVFRRPDGSLEISDPVWVADLDRFSLPAYHLIKNSYYRRGRKGAAVVVASRGCPLNCSYCSFASRGGSGGGFPYRKRSVNAVVGEIETQVRDNHTGFIDFEDENLSLDRDWFMALLDEIRRRFRGRGIELRAMNGLFPPALDEGLIEAMQAAGFRTLNLAVGTTCRAQLKRFNRPDVGPAFEAALDAAQHHGLEAVGYVIAGAPDQAADTSLQDLLYLADKRVLAGVSIFYPAPGSADYNRCESRGLLPDRFSLLRSTALPVEHRTTRREGVTLLRLGRILNFLKLLKDKGVSLSPAYIPRADEWADLEDRHQLGLRLLQDFFQDGTIKGQTPDGHSYDHLVSKRLTRAFIEGLVNLDLQGVAAPARRIG